MPASNTEQERKFGKSRSRHAMLLGNYLNTLDLTASCGWHKCNDQYYYHRGSAAELFDHYLLILTIGGQGMAKIQGKDYVLTENSLMIFPREISHSYFVPQGKQWEFYWIHMTGPGCSSILEYLIRQYGYFHEMTYVNQIREQIEHLLSIEYSLPEYYYQSHLGIHRILVEVMNDLEQPGEGSSRRRKQIAQIMTYLETHYTEDLQLKDLSASIYLSVGHLIRLFRQETGMTPYQYLLQYRMREACVLLEESDMTVAEISGTVGYHSPSTFTAQFKSIYHLTPLDYRARCHRRV